MKKSTGRRFVRSYPDLQYTPIWKNRILFQLYHYCLYHAGWARRRWNGEIFRAGEFPMSQARCAKELGCSRTTVEQYLKKLEKLGMIRLSTSFKGTRVSLVSEDEIFALYPPPAQEDDEETEQDRDNFWDEPPAEQPLAAAPAYRPPMVMQPECDQVSEDFQKLWMAYPFERRTRRQEAEALFRSAVTQGADLRAFMDCLERDRYTTTWLSDNGKWIPGIVKWLGQEGWREFINPIPTEDELWTTER